MSETKSTATPGWPTPGVVRVSYAPEQLPALGDQPGTNRFDDPRPRTIDRFLIRYAGTTLRGCLLELLASFRPNPEAEDRIAAIDAEDPDLVEPLNVPKWQALHDYLDNRKVVTITADNPSIVSVNAPATQQDLDREPAVRAILDTTAAKSALLEKGGTQVHLDNAAIRLSSSLGRAITQACALALWDRNERPDVIHYRSRHDDLEDCWAIYNHAEVATSETTALNPDDPDHAAAVTQVAGLWQLALPPTWLARPGSRAIRSEPNLTIRARE